MIKLLEEGFKKLIYCNDYQTKIETKDSDNNNLTRYPLDASFQGVKRLFVLAVNNLLLMFLIIQLTILTIES